MLKSIFFPILEDLPLGPALDTACEIARRHQATLTVGICVNAVPAAAAASGSYPLKLYEAFGEAARESEAIMKDALEQALRPRDVSYRIQSGSSMTMGPSELAAIQARYFDLVVYGRSPEGNHARERAAFATLLLESGRPVIVAPPAAPEARAEGPALVAWKPTREASRAVHDALPLLARATSVRVLSVDPREGESAHGPLPGADIGAELAAHGLRVETVTRAKSPGGTADTLLRDAREQGAGLLVAGGYGHHRVREFVFGGTTRELFDASLPVLFSH